MILRNLQLNEQARRELKNQLFDDDSVLALLQSTSLVLSNISTCLDDFDEGESEMEKHSRQGGLNCDFLFVPKGDTVGEARIEELTIERCRLDLEGGKVLGNALGNTGNNGSYSTVSSLRYLKMANLAFLDENHDDCAILRPILDGIDCTGTRGYLESIDVLHTPLPNSRAIRRRFFAAIGNCKNLKSLRLMDCDIRTDDAHDLARALRNLSHTLESFDLSRNHLDGAGLEILLKNGLNGNTRLRRLVLSHNPVGDDGAIHLSRFLSRTSPSKTRIHSLWMVDCDVWSAGCHAMCERLKNFDTLSELVVCGEWENHFETVAESLRTNVVLKHLLVVSDFGYDDISVHPHQRYRDIIEYYLALNRAHRRISIEHDVSFQLWPTVLAEKKATNSWDVPTCKADVWYHLLQRRPELVATADNLAIA
jgi:hypothetical protein